jgi:CBS domain-containing protein
MILVALPYTSHSHGSVEEDVMRISEVMTKGVQYLPPDTNLMDAARKMRDIDCGFLPVSNAKGERLAGVITDRDIAIRAVAAGMDPSQTKVSEVMSAHVDYCYAKDALESATDIMSSKGIYRLVVLDDAASKKLCGVISLGDVLRHNREDLATHAAKEITHQ